MSKKKKQQNNKQRNKSDVEPATINNSTCIVETSSNSNDKKEFLKVVYEQSYHVYTSFVSIRFQIIALFVSNAVLFDYINKEDVKKSILLTVSITAIFFTWVLFFIDKRNKAIFRQAHKISSKIEEHFRIPIDLRLYNKNDLKSKISHSSIFFVITITLTLFWLLIIFFPSLIF